MLLQACWLDDANTLSREQLLDAVLNHPFQGWHAYSIPEGESNVRLRTNKFVIGRIIGQTDALKSSGLQSREPSSSNFSIFGHNDILRGRTAAWCSQATGQSVKANVENLFPF